MGLFKKLERLVRSKLTDHNWDFHTVEAEQVSDAEIVTGGDRQWAHRVLEVHEGASREEVRRAYLRLSRKYHPDNFSDREEKLPVANKLMAMINKAYRLLAG